MLLVYAIAACSGLSMIMLGKFVRQNQKIRVKESNQKQAREQIKKGIESPIKKFSFLYIDGLLSDYYKLPILMHRKIQSETVKEENTQTQSKIKINQVETKSPLNLFQQYLKQQDNLNPTLWKLLENYSEQLVKIQKCDKVETFNGPIFSKDRQYKKKQQFPNVFISEHDVFEGQVIPDKYYHIIHCQAKEESYYNAFQFRSKQNNLNEKKLINFVKPLLVIEEKTGIKFRLKGKQLSLYDFNFLNKLIDVNESKQAIS